MAEEILRNLNPVQYNWSGDDRERVNYGLIPSEIDMNIRAMYFNGTEWVAPVQQEPVQGNPSDIDMNIEEMYFNGTEWVAPVQQEPGQGNPFKQLMCNEEDDEEDEG